MVSLPYSVRIPCKDYNYKLYFTTCFQHMCANIRYNLRLKKHFLCCDEESPSLRQINKMPRRVCGAFSFVREAMSLMTSLPVLEVRSRDISRLILSAWLH